MPNFLPAGRTAAGRINRRALPIVLLALVALSCGGPAKGPEVAAPAGGWHPFQGTGTATGHRQTLQMGPDRKVSIVDLTGSLLLVGEQRLGEGFRSEFIGYSDTRKGGVGWCVWTDSRGDQLFSSIRGGPIGTASRFTGTFLGGTGRYAGVTGEYGFEWQYVVEAEDGVIQGRIVSLAGRFRRDATVLPAPVEMPGTPEGGRRRP